MASSGYSGVPTREQLKQTIAVQEGEIKALRSALQVAQASLGVSGSEGNTKKSDELLQQLDKEKLEKERLILELQEAEQGLRAERDAALQSASTEASIVRKLNAEVCRMKSELQNQVSEAERTKENEVLKVELEAVRKENRELSRAVNQVKILKEQVGELQREKVKVQYEMEAAGKLAVELREANASLGKEMEKLKKEGEAKHRRWEEEVRVRSQVNSGRQFYHVVLRIPHLLDAASCEEGWPLLTVRDVDLARCKAIPVTVLGGFNKGKTYIFTRLANELCLQSGTSVETEGISLRIAQLQDGRDVMLIDTAGKGQAIPGWTPKKSREAQGKEAFITQVAHHMAQVYIYVVEYLEEQDQERLYQLMEDMKATRRPGTVVVVHNMRNISKKEEWSDRKNCLIDLLRLVDGDQWEHIQDVRVPIFGGREGRVEYLSGPNQRHYFLGCDDSASGKDNPYVFKSIMDFIGHVGSSDVSVQDRVLSALNAYINRYYNQAGSLQIREEEGKEGIVMTDPTLTSGASGGAPVRIGREGAAMVERRIRWVANDGSDGRSVGLRDVGAAGCVGGIVGNEGSPEEVSRNESRCNVWEFRNNRLVVQIDAPGVMRKEDLNVTISRQQGVHLTIKGTRGPSYCTDVHPEVRKAISMTACCPEFSVNFRVASEFEVPPRSQVVRDMVLENGVLQLEFFPFEEEGEDDEA